MSRLETGMSRSDRRENASMRGFRRPSDSCMEWYSSLRISYSLERKACVTPSTLSSTAMAKS